MVSHSSETLLGGLAPLDAVVTTLTETAGAVDLTLVKSRHNYFISTVSLTGELVWNLPSAAEWPGVEVTAVRAGGSAFDLALTGTGKRLRKGEMITVVSDGTSWVAAENRRGLAQVRETSNMPTLSFETHSGKLTMLTSGTAITCKLKDTSPTDSTYWVMVEANASVRTTTFAAADGADGDGTTIRNPGAFTVPANTPWLFMAYVSGNADGASAIYQVTDLSGGTGGGGSTEGVAGGTFNPLSITIANSLTSYDQYDQSGAVTFAFNNAGSTIHLGEAVVYFNSDGVSALTWPADIVDGATGDNADLPSVLPAGIQKLVFVYDEVLDRCELYRAQGVPTDFGGAVLSNAEFRDIAETVIAKGTLATGAVSFDYAAGGYQWGTTGAGNISSIAITNPPATGKLGCITLEFVQGATPRTIAWGAAFRFPGGTDYTLTASAGAVDIFTLMTRDGGSTWRVFEGGKAFAP